jgi:hypothetical protein
VTTEQTEAAFAAKCKIGRTALLIAAEYGRDDLVEELMRRKFDAVSSKLQQ